MTLPEIFGNESYQVLTSTTLPDEEEIKRAYFQAVKLVHPDRHAAASMERQICSKLVHQIILDAWNKYEKQKR